MNFEERSRREEYKGNSHREKERRADIADKKVSKVISGNAKIKKKSGLKKIGKSLIAADVENVKTYLISDVLIPEIKNIVYDLIHNFTSMTLYGETGRDRRSSRSNVSYVSYDRFSRSWDRRRSHDDRSSRSNHSPFDEDIILDSRDEAEEVLTQLDLLIETYHVASVSDLYDLVGQTGPYTGNRYGWTNLKNAQAVRLRDGGYLLKMPKALPIE